MSSRVKTSYRPGELFGLLSTVSRSRALIWEMAKREITDRYLGQVLGTFWAIGHPLILMGVYVFIFAYVLKVKVGGTRELPLDYTTYLLSGLIPWMCFQETLAKSCVAITNQANLVKQTIFPLEVLPIKGVLASLITMFISLALLLIYVVLKHGYIPMTYLLIPVLILVQSVAMIGVGYYLSALTVFLRDIKDFVQVFGVVGPYLMPVFYLPHQVPAAFRPFLYLNPFSYLIWCYQDVLYFGRLEHPYAWPVFFGMSILLLVTGLKLFQKLRLTFGNAL